jgi:adenylate kinase
VKIALTGTPGTGKTTVAEKLADEDFDVLDLTEFFEEKDIGEQVNGEREIRVEQMTEELQKQDFKEDTVIEGHLSHHFPVDICVVLRCSPDVLEERLSSRKYSDRKVEENVEAEKLDIILSEAVQNQETVIEINTTEKSVEGTIEEILGKVKKGESDYGDVDWTEFL